MKKNKQNSDSYKSYADADGEVKELDAQWFEDARPSLEVLAELGITPPARGRPALSEADRKKRVTIMLDQDVIEHFKKSGKGWQTRANAALRKAAGLPQK